jgi:hypothetical protein
MKHLLEKEFWEFGSQGVPVYDIFPICSMTLDG